MPKQLILEAVNNGILLDSQGQILARPGFRQFPDRIYLAHQVRQLQAERDQIARYFHGRSYSLDELLEITGYRESVV